MGLDAVELLMGVEEQFELEIPDDDASQILTVGQLVDYITSRQVAAGRPNVNADIVLDQLRTLIPYHLGVSREEVTLAARFEDLYD